MSRSASARTRNRTWSCAPTPVQATPWSTTPVRLPLVADRSTSSTDVWDAFFSDFYLRAYASEERDLEAETQALAAAKLTGCPEGGELLDAPCGFGRHSIPLARAGFRVTGVDRSGALLAEARRRAHGERWPKFVQTDYRELPFPDESFDAAVNLFTSLGYLGDEQDERVLAGIHRVLRPGAPLGVEAHGRGRPGPRRAAPPR